MKRWKDVKGRKSDDRGESKLLRPRVLKCPMTCLLSNAHALRDATPSIGLTLGLISFLYISLKSTGVQLQDCSVLRDCKSILGELEADRLVSTTSRSSHGRGAKAPCVTE